MEWCRKLRDFFVDSIVGSRVDDNCSARAVSAVLSFVAAVESRQKKGAGGIWLSLVPTVIAVPAGMSDRARRW